MTHLAFPPVRALPLALRIPSSFGAYLQLLRLSSPANTLEALHILNYLLVTEGPRLCSCPILIFLSAPPAHQGGPLPPTPLQVTHPLPTLCPSSWPSTLTLAHQQTYFTPETPLLKNTHLVLNIIAKILFSAIFLEALVPFALMTLHHSQGSSSNYF